MTTIETHQIVTVRRPVGAAVGWCSVCLGEVEVAPLEGAALLAGVSVREICRRVGSEHVHLVETADGTLVCLASLLNKVSLGDGELNPYGADALCLPAVDPGEVAD